MNSGGFEFSSNRGVGDRDSSVARGDIGQPAPYGLADYTAGARFSPIDAQRLEMRGFGALEGALALLQTTWTPVFR